MPEAGTGLPQGGWVVGRTADARVHTCADTGAVTYHTPMTPPRKPSFWSQRSPLQRAGLIVAALILPCCGGVTVIAALTDKDPKTETVSGTGNNLADVLPIATTKAATDPAPVETTTAATKTPPQVITKLVTTQAKIPYKTKRVDDDSLAKGRTRVRTAGVNGVKTTTYEVTLTDGKQTARRVVKTETTRKPVTKVITVGTKAAPANKCDPNYSGCVPVASDVDCAGGSGNGPKPTSTARSP